MSQEISATMNEYLPLRDVVFQTLRQAILRGELEPGERLMEIHLGRSAGRKPDADPGGHKKA